MKRIICAALVCMMLAAMVVVPTSAAQSNVDVNALKFTAQPTIDGVISEEEWGAATVTVNANEAATKEDAEQGVSPFNTYFEYSEGGIQDPMLFEKWNYDLWFRYDDEYFYIAVKVNDPNGHAAPNQGENIWNNDMVQVRIDPQGPNSIMLKDDPSYDYKTTEFNYKKYNFSDNNKRAWNNATSLINAGFALVAGETSQAFDMEPAVVMDTTLFKCTTVDKGDGETDFTCETSYEIAIPWGVIGDKVMGEGYKGETGNVLGLTLVVINSSGGSYDALLTWGSGVCGGQAKNARATSGGSNAITLAAETVTPAADYAVATEPVTDDTTAEAPTTTAAPDTTKDTAADTQKPTNNNTPKPNYNDVKDGGNTALIIGIIAAVVVVVAVVVVIVVKKKKK